MRKVSDGRRWRITSVALHALTAEEICLTLFWSPIAYGVDQTLRRTTLVKKMSIAVETLPSTRAS